MTTSLLRKVDIILIPSYFIEIIEYAKYLGFELPGDEDLLYIATEGLKAPLPEPWKACQTKEGEIYYYNPETGESTWDHPLDEHYKKLYQEAKKEKLRKAKKQNLQDKAETSNLELSPANVKPGGDHFVDEKNFSNLLDKLSPIAGESYSQRQNKSEAKEPLNNKEIEELRRKKEEEFQLKKQELEQIYQEKIARAQQENQTQLQNLIQETNARLQQEKEKIQAEKFARRKLMLQNDSQLLDEFKQKLLEELREKNKLTLDKVRKEHETKIAALKESLAQKKADKIAEVKTQLEKKKRDELGDLEKKLVAIQTEIVNLNMSNVSPTVKKNLKQEEEAYKAFVSQQEDHFYNEKMKIMKIYEEKCKELKAIELEKYHKELEGFPKFNEVRDEKKAKLEEESYIISLEVENQNKLSQYQQELQQKKEAARLSVIEKLNDIEKRKHEEILTRLSSEYKNKLNEWLKEKGALEEKFNLGT